MTTFLLVLPPSLPTFSIALTTSIPEVTRPKNHVLAVQPGGFGRAEEELASVGVGAGVGHGEDAGSGVLLDEILVGELVAVDGLAAGAVAAGEVASLAHEAGNDAMEGGARVAEPLLPGAEVAEVLAGFGYDVRVQRHHDAPGLRSADRHVEEDFGFRHFLSGLVVVAMGSAT